MITPVPEPSIPELQADSALLDRAREINWYHTMELAPDFTTSGEFDHRQYVDHYGLPERMDGMRALDVATFNGFWAFEMERRGAEVVALDLGATSSWIGPPSDRGRSPRRSRKRRLGRVSASPMLCLVRVSNESNATSMTRIRVNWGAST